jgi:hypothetical protein
LIKRIGITPNRDSVSSIAVSGTGAKGAEILLGRTAPPDIRLALEEAPL